MKNALRVAARVGIILPAYVNSGGKALLAEQSDDAVRRLYAGTAFASTSRTIPSLEALIAELRETREATRRDMRHRFEAMPPESDRRTHNVVITDRWRGTNPVAGTSNT